MCERNINKLPFTRPYPGTWPTNQACALTGNRTSNLSICRLALNPLSHASQGLSLFLNDLCEGAGSNSHNFMFLFSHLLPKVKETSCMGNLYQVKTVSLKINYLQ